MTQKKKDRNHKTIRISGRQGETQYFEVTNNVTNNVRVSYFAYIIPPVREKLHQPPTDVCVHYRSDVGGEPIAQVAQRPAGVAQDLTVRVLQQLGEGGDNRVHVQHRAGLPVAEIAQRPRPNLEKRPRPLSHISYHRHDQPTTIFGIKHHTTEHPTSIIQHPTPNATSKAHRKKKA